MAADPILARWNDFAKAASRWIHFAADLSPYSLDYRQRIAERWHELRIGELFRRLEALVVDWR